MLDLIHPASAECVLEDMILDRFAGKIALVSSFGTESAILLHMVSRVDKNTPVVFLDTQKLFPETLAYRDELVARLGLTNVRSVRPSGKQLAAYDPDGRLDEALEGFSAWITGRKRVQGGVRGNLNFLETGPDGRTTVNPLAFWDDEDIEAYFERWKLPRHPLEADGYSSIGCTTCTMRALPGEDKRSGRWAGLDKTECGIHLPRSFAA
jgi:phosphoadenosine phosphosulfate reductase